MKMKEVCQAAGLTKKAVEYYEAQGLVSPTVLENGYRAFSAADEARLKQVAVLRGLGLGVEEIRSVLVGGENLAHLAARRALALEWAGERQFLLKNLAAGADWTETAAALERLESKAAVSQRLMRMFPGDYGRFLTAHFARFLDVPIQGPEGQSAFDDMVAFLDGAAPLALPEELETFLTETTALFGPQQMRQVEERIRQTIEHPAEFIAEHREMLEEYAAYRMSEAFCVSPAGRLQAALKEFCASSGYHNVFLPALRRLSPAYDAHCNAMAAADRVLLESFPELGGLEAK